MLLRLAFFAALLGCARAGTIQGIALEQASGRPLNRTLLRLTPLSKGGQAQTARAGPSGQFSFPFVAPGSYILQATREGFFPLEFGQRLAVGHGRPIEIVADTNFFAEMRLHHKGAVTGRVLDENGVGAAGVTVLAYRARLPIRVSGSAVSDDRGVYRVHGLDPGKYWVRSVAHGFDDGSGWLPTFGPQAMESGSARVQQVTVDNDTADADVRPEPGRLGHLGGAITCNVLGSVRVTMSSETEHRETETVCARAYRFDGVPPGLYEIFATLPDGSATGYTEVLLAGSSDGGNVFLSPPPLVEVVSNVPVTLIGFRRDYSESPKPQEIAGRRVPLAPGHWSLSARVPAGSYVVSIVNESTGRRRMGSALPDPDWFDVFIESGGYGRIVVTVSNQAGQIAGKSAPAAPVFLWPVAEANRRSLGGIRQVLCDADGQFRFEGLPPGDYRLLASFDAVEVDAELIEASRAPVVRVEAMQVATVELAPWVAP
jgi:hypothetical protein